MTKAFTPLVLCYHALSEHWEHALAVEPDAFRRQISMLLRRRWKPVSAFDVIEGRGRLFHVTFDDAFVSILPGLDTLERLGVPATIFACAAFADDGGRVFDVPELSVDAAAWPDELRTIGWDGLREVAARGFEIGGHTVSHPHLTQLTDDEIRAELRNGRERTEDELKRPCRFLAYPYGEEELRVRTAAARAGYVAAFALPGVRSDLDRFAFPRVGLYRRDGSFRSWAKTSRLQSAAPALIRAGRRLRRPTGLHRESTRA
jgi:peptidoglycan/xylan/chitin deacetylase (PgdA/CDA1 family)